MYIADPQHDDYNYGSADDLHEIDLYSTAGEIFQNSKKMFPLAEKPLVIVKLFYVSTQN